MAMYYSASTQGFFDLRLKASYDEAGSWPDDATPVAECDYRALFDGQKKGKVITANKDGYPVLGNPPAPTTEQLQKALVKKNRH